MAKIIDLWDGSMEVRKVSGLVPCCGQDGYRAQVLQQTIDSNNIYINIYKYVFCNMAEGPKDQINFTGNSLVIG